MNLQRAQPIIEAVLYEGYILYPYRPTATKNQQRWTFGGVYPQAYFEATGGADPCHMQTQCLLEGDPETRLEVHVRFLHPLAREVGRLREPLDAWPTDYEPDYEGTASLMLGGNQYHRWQEVMERDVTAADCRLGKLLTDGLTLPFTFPGWRELEPLVGDDKRIQGVLERRQHTLTGRIDIVLEPVPEGVYRLGVRIENHSSMEPTAMAERDTASLYSLASTHILLGVEAGSFHSLMDPPDELAVAAGACDNQGVYPVLVGNGGARDTLLASPIILYDYPEVAPESAGDLYDATEIDEILSLNILAMTDDEKQAMVAGDPRAAALLARTEDLNGDDFLRMHGTLRETPQPSSTRDAPSPLDGEGWNTGGNPLEPATHGPQLADYNNGQTQLKVGDRVRLRPVAGGDVMDLALAGRAAMIEGIERDFEDRVYVAVALDDDPGREWGLARMPGHRFFFSPEEIVPLAAEAAP